MREQLFLSEDQTVGDATNMSFHNADKLKMGHPANERQLKLCLKKAYIYQPWRLMKFIRNIITVRIIEPKRGEECHITKAVTESRNNSFCVMLRLLSTYRKMLRNNSN